MAARPAADPLAEEALEQSFRAIREGRDPAPFYHALRERSRVYFSRRRGMWVLTGLAEVEQVLRSPVALLQYPKRMDKIRADWREHPASANLIDVIAFADGPPHQKVRKALQPTWTKPEMEKLRPHLRQRVEELVEAFVSAGGGNVYTELALPMAEETVFRMFGIDEEGARHLRHLVDAFLCVHDYDATPEQLSRADMASQEMREFWTRAYHEKARNPGGDMLSDLVRNPGLTEAEGIHIAESVYVGGFDSTALTATTGLWIMLNHREEMERARRDDSLLEKAPEEVLRMAGAVPMTLRVAAEPIHLGDHVIEADELIGVGLLAANRDPAVFPDPDRFDLSRPRSRMVSFSSGVHTCLGHFLARMELFELYKALLERTTRIDVADARFRKDRQAAFGMDTLNLTVT